MEDNFRVSDPEQQLYITPENAKKMAIAAITATAKTVPASAPLANESLISSRNVHGGFDGGVVGEVVGMPK